MVSITANAGVAAFSGLALARAGSGNTIQIQSPGLTGTASSPITVVAAAATQLVLASEPPTSVDAGAGFGLVAVAEDPFGNIDPRYGRAVNLAVSSDPGGAKLGGTLAIAVRGGVATFSGLTLDRGGSGYTLVLTGQGLGAALTDPIAVIPPPAQVVRVSVQKLRVSHRATNTVVVVQFDEPLNAAAAQNLGAYMLASELPGRKHAIRLLPLARSSYNTATNTVTLMPARKLVLGPPVQLRIIASVLTDALGRPLDGNDDGQPGGEFVATVRTHVVDALLSAGFRPRGARVFGRTS
jgi:hypothetical protein